MFVLQIKTIDKMKKRMHESLSRRKQEVHNLLSKCFGIAVSYAMKY